MSRPLTLKQRLFVESYLGAAAGNATEAARIAGYAEPNTQGPRLLVNVGIRELVEKRVSAVAMDANRVLALVSGIAEANLGDFLAVGTDGSGTIDLRKAKGNLRALRKFTTTEHGASIELVDRLRALKLLGDHFGLWNTPPKDDIDILAVATEAQDRAKKRRLERELLDRGLNWPTSNLVRVIATWPACSAPRMSTTARTARPKTNLNRTARLGRSQSR